MDTLLTSTERSKARGAPRLTLVLCALVLGACDAPPLSSNHPLAVRAADKKLEDIPAQDLSGKLRGAPWKLADARVRIEKMEGRERVDLFLADEPITRCGLPIDRKGRRVWLRMPGRPALDGAPMRAEVGKQDELSVHYEMQVDHKWLGHGGGAALLSLRERGFGKYEGRIWTCFDDGLGSCVTGRFEASACKSELDVDDSVWGAARVTEREKKKRAE